MSRAVTAVYELGLNFGLESVFAGLSIGPERGVQESELARKGQQLDSDWESIPAEFTKRMLHRCYYVTLSLVHSLKK